MNQLFYLNTNTSNSNSLLELVCFENPDLELIEVVAVFGTSLPNSKLPTQHSFQLGDIVTQGRQYGIVTSLNETDRPVTITWDESSEFEPDVFAYTLDEIRFFNISIVPQLVPFKTIVELPANITIKLANTQLVKFSQAKYFLVESITDDCLIIRSLESRYCFTKELLPGRLFACVIDLPNCRQIETASSLSFPNLKTWVKLHLELFFKDNLEFLTPTKKQQLFDELVSLLAGQNYDTFALNAAWEEVWKQQIETLAQDQGFHGIRLGARILRQRGGTELFGTIVELNIELTRPFQIQWDSGKLQSYSLTELRCLGITQIKPVIQLSPNVAYQISEDGCYFKAWIGFRTKALAKAWWRLIKQQVGYLSHLQDCYSPELRHTDKRYEYLVEKPRQKTLTKRLESLQKVAELILEQMP